MRCKATVLRSLIHNRRRLVIPFLPETLKSGPNFNSLLPSKPFSTSAVTPASPTNTAAKFQPPLHFTFRRCLTSSAAGPSNVVAIDSTEKFNSFLRKVEDEAVPAIFYFTAAWCGPCRLLYPVLAELSEKYPHVTTYKIDIDQDGIGSVLSKLNIYSVPTLHFFKDGKKASEVVGADIARLRDTMETLYK